MKERKKKMKSRIKFVFGTECIPILEEIEKYTRNKEEEYQPMNFNKIYHADNESGERLTIKVNCN